MSYVPETEGGVARPECTTHHGRGAVAVRDMCRECWDDERRTDRDVYELVCKLSRTPGLPQDVVVIVNRLAERYL